MQGYLVQGLCLENEKLALGFFFSLSLFNLMEQLAFLNWRKQKFFLLAAKSTKVLG